MVDILLDSEFELDSDGMVSEDFDLSSVDEGTNSDSGVVDELDGLLESLMNESEPSVEDLEASSEELSDLEQGLLADSAEPVDSLRSAFGQYMYEVAQYELLDTEEQLRLGKLIREGQLAQRALNIIQVFPDSDLLAFFMRVSDKLPLFESEQVLQKKIDVGKAAADKLTVHNLRLVVAVAKRFHTNGLDFEDAVQIGNIGLLRAVQSYDYTQGNRFSTYAVYWIRQGLYRHIANTSRLVRLPVQVYQLVNRLKVVSREFEVEHGRMATVQELSELLDVPTSKVQELLVIQQDVVSLDYPVLNGETDATLGDFVVDESALDAELEVQRDERLQEILVALSTLSPRSEHVLRILFGFEDGVPRTLSEAGVVFGLSRERVRQLESKALRMLRSPAHSKLLWDYRGCD